MAIMVSESVKCKQCNSKIDLEVSNKYDGLCLWCRRENRKKEEQSKKQR